MATNYIEEGKKLYLGTADGAESGDPMVLGSYLPVVLLTDAASANPYEAAVQTEGVFNLSVKAIDGSGNSAVSVGDAIYYNSGDTPVLNKKSAGEHFGIALEAITTGETDTIKVLLTPKAGLGGVGTAQLADAVQDKVVLLSISAADQTDGTADVTVQVTDIAGNELAANVMFRFWTGGADDFGIDALTGIAANPGTIVTSHTAHGDLEIVTDATGEAVLACDKGSAGSIYCWASVGGLVYETGEVSITGP